MDVQAPDINSSIYIRIRILFISILHQREQLSSYFIDVNYSELIAAIEIKQDNLRSIC